jgi:hypothetical protein
VANRLAGVLAIKDTYFLRSFIPGSTISSSWKKWRWVKS